MTSRESEAVIEYELRARTFRGTTAGVLSQLDALIESLLGVRKLLVSPPTPPVVRGKPRRRRARGALVPS
jgi:hypothetical protein